MIFISPYKMHMWIINKDHQRMMVDPMIMIAQSLRPLLIAVTPTAVIPSAVAPIAVILPEFYLNFT